MKIVIQYGANYQKKAIKLILELRKLINNDPLFPPVLGPGGVTVNKPDTLRVLLNKVEYLRFQKDVLGRLPTAQEIADYIKVAGD